MRTIDDLERQQVQSNMDAESIETSLKEEKEQLKTQNLALENEISSLQEKIEAFEDFVQSVDVAAMGRQWPATGHEIRKRTCAEETCSEPEEKKERWKHELKEFNFNKVFT